MILNYTDAKKLSSIGEINKMATLKEQAKAYEPPQTKNIAELDQIDVNVDISEAVRAKKDGTEFRYNYIIVDEIEYRVPDSVLKQLKVHLKNTPSLRTFKVVSEGTGMNTEYTVIPLASGSEKAT